MKDLKKEMVGYKISLLRDLYIQHEKPSNSTLTVKKKAILKQMEEIFEEVKEDIPFPNGLTFLKKIQAIVFTSNELTFMLKAERYGVQILYKKYNGRLSPCVRITDSKHNRMNLNEEVEVKLSKQVPLRGIFKYEKTMLVFPKD